MARGETDVNRDAGDRVRAFLPKRVIFESIGREWHDHSLIVDRGGVDVQVDERGYLLVMPSGGEMAAVDGYNLVAIMVGSVVAGHSSRRRHRGDDALSGRPDRRIVAACSSGERAYGLSRRSPLHSSRGRARRWGLDGLPAA